MKKLAIIMALWLPLGLFAQNIVELKLPKSNKLVVKFEFRNGSISDPAGKEGLTEMTASLINGGGTSDHNPSQIKDLVYPMASQWGYRVDKEVTVFTFEFHKDFQDQFYPIMMGLLATPSFAKDDFDRIKKGQQNYVDQSIRNSSDEEYSKLALEDFLFRGTNYQHPVPGRSSSVSAITLDDVKSHYSNYFNNSNLTIGIAGNYSKAYLSKIKKDIAVLGESKSAIPTPGVAAEPDGINVEIISKPNTLGSAIFTGTPLSLTRADNDFASLMIANSWLGEHRKSYSRLYQKIRQERSMNYGDYTYIEWYSNGGSNMLPVAHVPRHSNYFGIWIRPVQTAISLKGQYEELSQIKIGHAHFALRMAIREVEELTSKGMSQEDFEATREFLKSYIKLYVQTPEKQLGFLMDSKFYDREDYIGELDILLDQARLEDVNKMIKEHFDTKNMCITIVTDATEAEPLKKSLLSGSPSPMAYSNDLRSTLGAEILDEDDIVAKYPLKVKSVTVIQSNETFKEPDPVK